MIKTLTLIFATLTICGNASGQSEIHKCIKKGKVIYTDEKCDKDATHSDFIYDDEKMGNVSPDRATIEATRERIRNEMTASRRTTIVRTTTTTTTNGPDANSKKIVCDSAILDIQNLDSMARQPSTPYTQDAIKQRKMDAQKKLIDYQCN